MPNRSLATGGVSVLAGLILFAMAIATGVATPIREADHGPEVRVVSPHRGAGHIVGPSSETKALIVLEIVDVGGRGIMSDDFGRPRFQEANRNVNLFSSNIVAKGQWVNGIGHTVTQLVATVPTERMKTGGNVMTPPIDAESLGPTEEIEYVEFGEADPIPVASFRFQVMDYEGRLSDPKKGQLTIGLAPSLWTPPASAIHFKKKREGSAPQDSERP